ncbi:MAG TPA: CBS domain-containing protein [Methanothermococcus okinawensis]|uniref:CBS domain-containing protein n=1 Tax=Methanothermococcus okinawensis TaxID=155863 RepID=A0A832ZBU5_9EURY|nr:CBS domain-containing protein [Methanococcaceae archaeon]HIP84551.1 CBS domain-containing protein [Methanothermococcus okinawensis]HIP90834.1 CBS domain-containing protein [Methanothermococcus okinawensis]
MGDLEKHLTSTPVKEIMTSDVIHVYPEESIIKAFEKLLKYRISCLPVVDRERKIVGIITTTDIGHNLIEDRYTLDTTVGDVMTKEVVTIKPGEPVINAIKKMDEYGDKGEIINQLPVVDEDNRIVGIISDGDIIKFISRCIKK